MKTIQLNHKNNPNLRQIVNLARVNYFTIHESVGVGGDFVIRFNFEKGHSVDSDTFSSFESAQKWLDIYLEQLGEKKD
jgi:hypothetical protein